MRLHVSLVYHFLLYQGYGSLGVGGLGGAGQAGGLGGKWAGAEVTKMD